MEALEVQGLINEILNGSSRAVVAILIIVVVVLIYEVRNVRKDYRELQDRSDAQRGDFLKVLNESRDQYSKKNEEMIVKYHALMAEVQLNMASFQSLIDKIHQDLAIKKNDNETNDN